MVLDRASAVRLGSALLDTARAGDWRGPDPYDGLWWPGWPGWLSRRPRGRQCVIQLHARAPVDLRKAYRREHPLIAKALAVFGTAATRLAGSTGDEGLRALARDALSRLDADRAAGGRAWGYPFPVQTRWSFYPAHTPNVIATSFAAHALGEAGEVLAESAWAGRAREAAEWVGEALWDETEGHFVYHPGSHALIHNANLLGARTVWRWAERSSATGPVTRAVERTLAAQRSDGSFPYGEGGSLGWVDSFHTGYVLEALCDLRDADSAITDAIRRAAEHWIDHFFGPRGEARLYPDRSFPQDGHSAGTALSTLAALARAGILDLEDLSGLVAGRVATHVVRGGHAINRRWRFGTSRVIYPRWCDAHVALGLASYGVASGSDRPTTS